MPLTQVSSRLIEDTLRYVLGANGTSDYTFTGKGLTGAVNDPTLTLSRGHTYIFENRNSTNAHPFYIKTSIANGGTNDAYNTGVTNNGGAGGTEIVFTVPHDAPDTLYYQCSSHSSMAGQLNIAGSVADGSITETKLANGSVTSSKLGADCVIGSKIADSQIASEHIVDQAVTLAKLEHGTSSNDGKFLRANNGADPTFETIDLTALSASNLTSGTIPDARFPATLPAASATNLTAIPAANITGTLPAISATNLTNIPAANITGTLPAIDGSALTGVGGKMVNYSQTFKTDTFSADIPQGSYSSDAISISYAAASSSNKLLIICHLMIAHENTQRIGFGLFAGGSIISAAIGNADGNRTRVTMAAANGGDSRAASISQTYLHSSPSTSSTTYSCRLWQGDNSTKMTYLNRTHWNGNYDYGARGTSSITILELEP